MAPRTPEQQAAYNEKRRLANAVKKVERIQKAEKVHKAKVAKKPKGKAEKIVKAAVARKLAAKKPTAPHIEAVDGPKVKVVEALVTTKVHRGRRTIEEVHTAKPKPTKPKPTKPKVDIVKQVKMFGADSLLPPDDPKAGLLMAKSHRREFRGNGATQRGTGWQVTVMFTEDQLNVLKERAGLYNVSLSEAVRRCVMSGPLPE
jgi:hypothetical protein